MKTTKDGNGESSFGFGAQPLGASETLRPILCMEVGGMDEWVGGWMDGWLRTTLSAGLLEQQPLAYMYTVFFFFSLSFLSFLFFPSYTI